MVKISGGDALEAKLKEISKNLSKAASVDVGFLENATYPDGESVAKIAAIQEFGAPGAGIPPRPFFRYMIQEKSPEWPEAVAGLLKDNDYDANKTLNQTGAAISGQLRQSIVDTMAPALSPVTVMLRGMRTQSRYADMSFWERFQEAKLRVQEGKTNYGASTKPLVDTGHMLNSIDYDVKS